jgi:hypothetical protein
MKGQKYMEGIQAWAKILLYCLYAVVRIINVSVASLALIIADE